MCLWCSALLSLAAALGLKMEQVHSDPAHTVIQERQLWSSCTDQCLLVPGAELAPALGAAWNPSVGCNAWDHFGYLYFTLPRLMGMGWVFPGAERLMWVTKLIPQSQCLTHCSHQCSKVCKQCPAAERGIPKGCDWVPACTGEWARLHSSSDVITRLEYLDENIYMVMFSSPRTHEGRGWEMVCWWQALWRQAGAPASFSQDIQPLQTAWGPLASSLHFAICFNHFLSFIILRLFACCVIC